MMTKLSDICMFQSGGTPSRKNSEYFNGNIPWVTTTALNGGTISLENANEWITLKAIEESAAKLVPAHSILVGTRVGVGKVAINLVTMSTSQDIISLTGIDQNQWNLEFLCKFISSKSAYLNSQARGATIKGIKIETLAELELPSYSIPEQHLISSAFNSLEKSISLRKQQLSKLDELVKSRFIELFGNCKTYVGFEECIEIKDNLRKPISSEERAKMQDGTLYPYYGATGQVGWINAYLSDFEGICIAEDCGNYAAGEASSYIVRGRIWVNNHAHLLKCRENINIYFLNEYFRQADLMDYVNGATRLKLTQSAMKTIPVLCPPLELQNKFAAFVEQIDKSKFEIQKSIEKLETLKKALMQKYFG